ncbi:MAG: hypothetical protein ABSH31_12495 [Bryobacteraceae bacterium]
MSFGTVSPRQRLDTPTIRALVSSRDFRSALAPGGLGTIFGSNLSDKPYAASKLPLPTQLGPTRVCESARTSP